MMRKVLPLTALVVCLLSGAAFADRDRHDRGRDRYDRHDRRGHVVREHRGDWNRGSRMVIRDRGDRYRDRVVIRNQPRHHYRHYNNHNTYNYRHVVRRPIYVSRPIIRHRYYNYYQRPALIVENYNTMPGYYWVRGQWRWDGYEWIWEPGHYEPDPNYVDPSYGYNYDYNY
jgi:hypothetical protein